MFLRFYGDPILIDPISEWWNRTKLPAIGQSLGLEVSAIEPTNLEQMQVCVINRVGNLTEEKECVFNEVLGMTVLRTIGFKLYNSMSIFANVIYLPLNDVIE
jgi:hypothetical protein